MKTVAGLVTTHTRAREVLEALQGAGFDPQLVSVITRPARQGEAKRSTQVPVEKSDELNPEATYTGITGWLISAGAIGAPTMGQAAALGPADEALGEDNPQPRFRPMLPPGGLNGALKSWGLSDEEARAYSDRVTAGDILMSVEVADDKDASKAQDVLREYGASGVIVTDSWHHARH